MAKKYIDADRLKAEIEGIRWFPQISSGYNDGREDMKIMVLDIIDSLQQEQPKCIYGIPLEERKRACKYCSAACNARVNQQEQPEVDLKAEIEMEWDSFNKHIAEYSEGTEEVVWLNWLSFVDIATYFYELGKKEEICAGCIRCTDEYWRGRKEAMEEANKGYHYTGPAIPTYFPPCFLGGPCTNPMGDCINCPRQSTDSITTATGTSTAKPEDER